VNPPRFPPRLTPWQRAAKRAIDLALAVPATVLALPLMAVIALLIKLTSPGPILFRQERLGENMRPFKMLKFRTMIAGAEELQEQVNIVLDNGKRLHKHENDPRVTKIGRLLRRWSLDELPQLFNVIRGDMSLVGPRPEMPWVVEQYEPWQFERFSVPQGITGWWQINGRAEKPMHLSTEDDIYYIRNYSLLLDIKILLKTPIAVIKGTGAY